MLGNYLQQTTFSDAFLLGILRVKMQQTEKADDIFRTKNSVKIMVKTLVICCCNFEVSIANSMDPDQTAPYGAV